MQNNISQRERVLSQSQALENITAELKFLSWNCTESSYGDSYPTTYCQLYDKNGESTQDGMGKGEGAQALLSSRFEALEHAITDLSQGLMQGIWKGSLAEAAILKMNVISDTIPVEAKTKTETLIGYWKTFSSSLREGNFIYPLSKLDPFSDYLKTYGDDELYRYFIEKKEHWFRNNNGSAIGGSPDDAYLHAYNEAIERYSLASLYVDCFLKPQASEMKLVRTSSLPRMLLEMLLKIASENKVSLSIIDMTCEINVPSFAVTASIDGKNIAIGYGTSVYRDYALQRALLECQQILHTRNHPIYGPTNDEDQRRTDLCLSHWPQLKAAIRLDLQACEHKEIDFPKEEQEELSVFEQRQKIEDIFFQQEIEVYSAVTYKSQVSSICAVRIIVPDFSDFSFIESGLPVVPSGRVLRRFSEDL